MVTRISPDAPQAKLASEISRLTERDGYMGDVVLDALLTNAAWIIAAAAVENQGLDKIDAMIAAIAEQLKAAVVIQLQEETKQ